jgi:hypothetical protein
MKTDESASEFLSPFAQLTLTVLFLTPNRGVLHTDVSAQNIVLTYVERVKADSGASGLIPPSNSNCCLRPARTVIRVPAVNCESFN